jgi:hypothetical protein
MQKSWAGWKKLTNKIPNHRAYRRLFHFQMNGPNLAWLAQRAGCSAVRLYSLQDNKIITI